MAYDGNTYSNRVDVTTERKLHAKVVDNVLTSRTYISRLMSQGKPFVGKTMDFTTKITNSGTFEWFTGLETLNSAAVDGLIQLSYSHVAGTQPQVSIMLDSFANEGSTGTISLDAYKHEEAAAEAVQAVGTAAFGDGTGNTPDGLAIGVDSSGTIGGQSRTTYATLAATETASGGTMTLVKLGTLDSTISASGIEAATPNINLTTKTIFDLYEQLLQPQVRADYQAVGYNRLPVKGNQIVKPSDSMAQAGFTSLAHRGAPVIKDDVATSGVWYKLNERTFNWYGRSVVPSAYAGKIEKVNLGTMKHFEGVGADTMPSEYNGWFHQPLMALPNQAGMIARFYVIGQICWTQPRRNGKLTGITGV